MSDSTDTPEIDWLQALSALQDAASASPAHALDILVGMSARLDPPSLHTAPDLIGHITDGPGMASTLLRCVVKLADDLEHVDGGRETVSDFIKAMANRNFSEGGHLRAWQGRHRLAAAFLEAEAAK